MYPPLLKQEADPPNKKSRRFEDVRPWPHLGDGVEEVPGSIGVHVNDSGSREYKSFSPPNRDPARKTRRLHRHESNESSKRLNEYVKPPDG